jgi:hypothetical protein
MFVNIHLGGEEEAEIPRKLAEGQKEGTRDIICDTGSLLLVPPFSQHIKPHNQFAIHEKVKSFSFFLAMSFVICLYKRKYCWWYFNVYHLETPSTTRLMTRF